MHYNKIFHILTVIIIFLTAVTSGLGLFYKTEGQPFNFTNQYGDIVKMYGNGIYKNDSYFMAPIFKGTDFTILFLVIPLSIIALYLDLKNNTVKTKLLLTALIALFAYYSASISFGIVYNKLFLLYMALFSCCFYALIIGFVMLNKYEINIPVNIYNTGLKTFLIFCGFSLFVAWLPDVIFSLIKQRPLDLIEIYTTQTTYILDMAIISPLMFICLYTLEKQKNIRYILLGIILTILLIVGVMLPVQTIFQITHGINIPIPAIITKVGIFVLLAIFAVYYEIKLFKNIDIKLSKT